ncbi:MAG: Zn-ribbon domain-containing OB-fold protein [Peptococcaceae bacterium]|nr:MAG: Zn-ribbon domain-containing OB-fold protein [Peptococcaceae bacterium]
MEYKLTYEGFYEALRKDKLVGLKCLECGAYTIPPKKVCSECAGEELEVVEFKGAGEVRTYTVVRVPPEGFDAPYVLGLVELAEGPWLLGRIVDVDPERVSFDLIGQKVKAGHLVQEGDKFSAGERVVVAFRPE